MSVEKLYQEVIKGTIKPEQLNDRGRAELRRYVEEKRRREEQQARVSSTSPAPSPTPTPTPTPRVSMPAASAQVEEPKQNLFQQAVSGIGRGLSAVHRGIQDFVTGGADTLTLGLAGKLERYNQREAGIEPPEKKSIARTAGEITGEALGIGKVYGVLGRAGRQIAQQAPRVAEAVRRLPSLVRTAGQGAAAGAIYGGAKEAADVAFDTRDNAQESLGERARNVGIEAAIGAGGDVAGRLIGMGAKAAAPAVKRAAEALLRPLQATRTGATSGADTVQAVQAVTRGGASVPRAQGESAVQAARSGTAAQRSPQFTPDGRPLLPRGDDSTTKVVRRSDIIKDLSKALDIPIRVGKYRYKAHGIFKVKPEVVRTKLANDIPTISHEVGHALDKRYGLRDVRFDDELMKLGRNTSGPNYTPDQVRNEGVAEFMRLVLTEPERAMEAAPKFFQHYETKIPAEIRAIISRAGEQIKSYINQPLLLKSLSQISDGSRSPLEKVRELISDRPFEKLYTKFVEELQPVRTALKELDDPKKAAQIFRDFRLLRGIAGRAQAYLRNGVFTRAGGKIGKSFEETIRPVMGNLDEFRSYLIEKRALELAERNIMTSSDLTPAERQIIIEDLEKRFPHFKQVQEELKEYQDHLLRELVDSGVLSADDVEKFKELNKEYVPFYRDINSGKKKGSGQGAGVANASNPIRRIKGSDRDIIDPLQSIIRNTYQYTLIAERNRVMKSLVDAATAQEGLGGLVEKIPTPMQGTKFTLSELTSVLEKQGVDVDNLDLDTVISLFRPVKQIPGKDNVIAVYRNGKREFYELDPDLYAAVTAADRDQMGVILRALNFPVRLLRSGVVNTLEFWLKNMWRDQFAAMINSRNGYIPYIDMIRGMAHVLGKTDTFNKFLVSGGAQAFRQSLDRNYLQQDLRRILAQSWKDKSLNILKHPIQAMQALSELSEMGTRLGEFSKGLKRGKNAREAAFDARDLIDFGRAGSIGRSINKVSAFWNAQMQGLDRTIRTFTDRKTAPKALVKAFAGITAPTAALYQLNKNDPRYQELPQWDKDLFWHFWIGDTHFRLPIPFELGVMFKVIPERILSMATGGEEPFRELDETVKDSIPVPTSIPDMIGMITALSPIAQAWANQNFTGGPIVPRREQDLEPVDQAGPYTSQTARAVARAAASLGAEDSVFGSPRKVDHIIRGYAGSLGQYLTQGIDAALEATGAAETVPRPATGLEQAPIAKAFLGRTISGSTESLDRFYERLDELTRKSNSAKKKGGSFAEAGELLRFRSTQRRISDLTARRRAIEEDPAMSPEQKRQEIDQINLLITNLARTALGKEPLTRADFVRTE